MYVHDIDFNIFFIHFFQVNLKVMNLPTKVDELACLYRKSSSLEGGLMRDTIVKGDSVDCGTFNPMGGGIYQFGVVLVPSTQAVR